MKPNGKPVLTAMIAALACSPAALAGTTNSTDSGSSDPASAPGQPLAKAVARTPEEAGEQSWNWHVQNTDIVQGNLGFPAKYSGPNSLDSGGEIRETVSLDLFAGARLWRGAEAHADGLLWQGFGLSKTLGLEGFPNGEAFRLGTEVPNVTFARLFIRQTIGLGGEQETVEDDQLHLAGKQDVSRLTLTLGKMSVKDIFDNNTYANDPRTQFMNWALMFNGAWDFPADVRGYTIGTMQELTMRSWSLRVASALEPTEANGPTLDTRIAKNRGEVAEWEQRYSSIKRPGIVRLLGYLNRERAGTFRDAPLVDGVADLGPTRRPGTEKYGFGVNLEQEITEDIGAFWRYGWSDGKTEAWAFTQIDRSLSGGISIDGKLWKRKGDHIGIAGVRNYLSGDQRCFLAQGGLGFIIGDGRLDHYRPESIVEAYYSWNAIKEWTITGDFQYIRNPAYNADRGPVPVGSIRLHWER